MHRSERNRLAPFLVAAFGFIMANTGLAGTEESLPSEQQPLSLERVDTDLNELPAGEYIVAKDSSGRVFLLEVGSLDVFEYSPRGDRRGTVTLQGLSEWPPGQEVAAFDVSPDGRWIAVSADREVSLFRDGRHIDTFDLDDPPAIVMSLAFVDSSPRVMVSRMFFVPAALTPSLAKSSEVLATIDRRGELRPFALAIDSESDPVPLASLKQQCSLQLDDEGRIWAADKARFRVRRFGSSGNIKVEISDEDVQSGIKEKEFDPESIAAGEDLTGSEARPTGWSGTMDVAIRAFDVAGGYLWIIANSGDPGGQRLDVIDVSTGEAFRIPLDQGLPIFGSVAVTDDLIVFGTANSEGRPMAFDRFKLDLAMTELELSTYELTRRSFSDDDLDGEPEIDATSGVP